MLLDQLKDMPLFQKLEETELVQLAQSIQTRTFPIGSELFRAKEPATHIHMLEEGTITLYITNLEGREKVIEIIRAGQTFAEAVAIVEGNYPVNARANENSLVHAVPATVVRQLIKNNPDLAFRMLSSVSVRLHKFVNDIHDLTLANAKQKVAGFLLAHAEQNSQTNTYRVKLPAGKAVLASRLGLQPETFSRVMNNFKTQNILREDNDGLLILDQKALQQQ